MAAPRSQYADLKANTIFYRGSKPTPDNPTGQTKTTLSEIGIDPRRVKSFEDFPSDSQGNRWLSVQRLIEALADEGDSRALATVLTLAATEAQLKTDGEFTFIEDQLREIYGNRYDAILLKERDQRVPELFDLRDGKFYSPTKEEARAYSLSADARRYKRKENYHHVVRANMEVEGILADPRFDNKTMRALGLILDPTGTTGSLVYFDKAQELRNSPQFPRIVEDLIARDILFEGGPDFKPPHKFTLTTNRDEGITGHWLTDKLPRELPTGEKLKLYIKGAKSLGVDLKTLIKTTKGLGLLALATLPFLEEDEREGVAVAAIGGGIPPSDDPWYGATDAEKKKFKNARAYREAHALGEFAPIGAGPRPDYQWTEEETTGRKPGVVIEEDVPAGPRVELPEERWTTDPHPSRVIPERQTPAPRGVTQGVLLPEEISTLEDIAIEIADEPPTTPGFGSPSDKPPRRKWSTYVSGAKGSQATNAKKRWLKNFPDILEVLELDHAYQFLETHFGLKDLYYTVIDEKDVSALQHLLNNFPEDGTGDRYWSTLKRRGYKGKKVVFLYGNEELVDAAAELFDDPHAWAELYDKKYGEEAVDTYLRYYKWTPEHDYRLGKLLGYGERNARAYAELHGYALDLLKKNPDIPEQELILRSIELFEEYAPRTELVEVASPLKKAAIAKAGPKPTVDPERAVRQPFREYGAGAIQELQDNLNKLIAEWNQHQKNLVSEQGDLANLEYEGASKKKISKANEAIRLRRNEIRDVEASMEVLIKDKPGAFSQIKNIPSKLRDYFRGVVKRLSAPGGPSRSVGLDVIFDAIFGPHWRTWSTDRVSQMWTVVQNALSLTPGPSGRVSEVEMMEMVSDMKEDMGRGVITERDRSNLREVWRRMEQPEGFWQRRPGAPPLPEALAAPIRASGAIPVELPTPPAPLAEVITLHQQPDPAVWQRFTSGESPMTDWSYLVEFENAQNLNDFNKLLKRMWVDNNQYWWNERPEIHKLMQEAIDNPNMLENMWTAMGGTSPVEPFVPAPVTGTPVEELTGPRPVTPEGEKTRLATQERRTVWNEYMETRTEGESFYDWAMRTGKTTAPDVPVTRAVPDFPESPYGPWKLETESGYIPPLEPARARPDFPEVPYDPEDVMRKVRGPVAKRIGRALFTGLAAGGFEVFDALDVLADPAAREGMETLGSLVTGAPMRIENPLTAQEIEAIEGTMGHAPSLMTKEVEAEEGKTLIESEWLSAAERTGKIVTSGAGVIQFRILPERLHKYLEYISGAHKWDPDKQDWTKRTDQGGDPFERKVWSNIKKSLGVIPEAEIELGIMEELPVEEEAPADWEEQFYKEQRKLDPSTDPTEQEEPSILWSPREKREGETELRALGTREHIGFVKGQDF